MNRSSAAERAIRLYDHIGPLADITAFYVDPALDRLTELARIPEAGRVVEVGAGTGRYAQRLLQNVLSPNTKYVDLEPSRRMRDLARRRLARWSSRAIIRDVSELPEQWYGTADRYVMTYVLNVLPSEEAIQERLTHAHRVLADDGLLCLVDQTFGRSRAEHVISNVWARVYDAAPELLGNCRILEAQRYLDGSSWRVRHREVACRFGFCSEVLVAAKR